MPSYLAKVRKKMNIHAQRRVRTALVGNYGSVFKGRSMDFDDLREYNYGDDIKDIDWKATARSNRAMIRRYVAVRKHNIMLVIDNGRSMAALSPSGEVKGEIATFCAAVFAYISQNHGDLTGCVFGNESESKRYALKEETAHIENFLNRYHNSIKTDAPNSNMNSLLSYITKVFSERMFVIVITDPSNAMTLNMNLIRRLGARHEQMYVFIEDSPLTNKLFFRNEAEDIDGDVRLPLFFRNNRKIEKAETELREQQRENIQHDLRRLGVVSTFVDSTDNAINQIYKMLEEQKRVRR